MKITANVLVKNEDNFIWFAINSIIDQVDEIIVWDTGSSDKTREVVKSIKSEKVKLVEKGERNAIELSKLRQEMLAESNCDWVFILDGDEIWWDKTIREEIKKAGNKSVIVSKTKMLIGDIFHFQDENAGRYNILGKVGHYNIRLFRRDIKGLHVSGIYPDEAYRDINEVSLQNLENEIYFSDQEYIHASHLQRSSENNRKDSHGYKLKYEMGSEFPLDFYYPEVLFRPRPAMVTDPWEIMDFDYKMRAYLVTPMKNIKRKLNY
jgi:glycosyltransferase involved in cell wall biosynthesis